MLKEVKQTTEFIREKTNNFEPQIGIILGTGLGGLTTEIEKAYELAYETIPNFPVSTVKGHNGKLIFGTLNGKKVVAMQGRFHYYEGYTMKQVVFPIVVMKNLNISHLFVSNASGGVNPDFEVGDIMIIRDHINLMANNPLIGPNEEELGPRFPDMHEAYCKKLVQKAETIAASKGIKVQKGIYAAVTGPTFETPAEYKYIRIVGADCVGMSTVPEVISARHMGLTVFAISVISDLGIDGKVVKVSHEEVIEAAKATEPKMTLLIKEMIAAI